MYNALLTSLKDRLFTITINRPEKLNALNAQVLEELGQVVNQVYDDDSIRAVIITGAGTKAFVAGADISEFQNYSVDEGMELARRGQQIFDRIEQCTKPVVAAVNGFALGGGCELAMSCHFRFASPDAKFGQPEINLGIIPGYGGTQRLTKIVGRGRAVQWMLTGQVIDAVEAEKSGLINRIIPAEELMAETEKIMRQIISKSPLATEKIIQAINAEGMGQQGFEEEIRLFGECFGTADMKEGVSAFLEKRKPVFSGR